jgi:hypothetical protein
VDDLFATLLRALDLPAWALLLVVALTLAAALFSGRLPAWAGVVLSALRAGAWAALRKRNPELAVTQQAQKAEGPPIPEVYGTATVPGEVVYTTTTTWGEHVTEGGISDEDRPTG